ncbi:uncharacterized protein LOC144159194 isoform X3 [Haemaphysalis longicornis]
MQRVSQPTHAKSRRSRRAKKSAGGAVSAQNANVNCWNSRHGCTFTGNSTSLARHLEQECRFNEITCAVCHVRVLQMEMSKHLWQDCSESSQAVGNSTAASVSAGPASRLLPTATVSPEDSPLSVGDVDCAFNQLKEMLSASTAHQIAVIETSVNELSEAVASLGENLVNVDESEQPDTADTTEIALLDPVVAKMGDISEQIVALRTAVLQSTDTAVKVTTQLQEQLGRCAQKEQLNGLESKVDKIAELVLRSHAQIMMYTAHIKTRCEILARESTVVGLRRELKGLIGELLSVVGDSLDETSEGIQQFCSFFEEFREDERNTKIGVTLILAVVAFIIFAKFILKLW